MVIQYLYIFSNCCSGKSNLFFCLVLTNSKKFVPYCKDLAYQSQTISQISRSFIWPISLKCSGWCLLFFQCSLIISLSSFESLYFAFLKHSSVFSILAILSNSDSENLELSWVAARFKRSIPNCDWLLSHKYLNIFWHICNTYIMCYYIVCHSL